MVFRTQIADVLKGIAVLLMIQVHIVELFADNLFYTSYFGKIFLFIGGPPVAPLFALLFGYFIARSQKTFNQLLIRGLKIIGLGMLLNIALNFNLILSVYKGLIEVDLWPYIFGIDILQFAGFSIIIIAFLKKVLQKSLFFTILCVFIVAFLGQFLPNFIPENIILKYISALFYGSTHWSYFPIFPWLGYPLAGMAFYKIQKKYDLSVLSKSKFILVIVLVFLMFMVFTLNYAISISSNLPLYYHHSLIFMLWVLFFLAFYSLLINEINKLIGGSFLFKYFKWLGENVSLIYVIQWIIIGNLATSIYKTISNPLNLLFYFMGILILSSSIGYLILKIKNSFFRKVD
jgi:uncharacterized membrane protein